MQLSDGIHNIYIVRMLRLICSSPFFKFCALPPVKEPKIKYVIKNKAYLIDAPPKRPSSGWSLYLAQQFAGKTNLKVTTDTPALAKKWKSYAQIRDKYNKLAEQKNQGYQKIRNQYQQKFIIPFKRISGHNLRLKKLFTDNKIKIRQGQGIQGVAKQVTRLLQDEPRTLKEDQELKQEAKRISAARQAERKKYQFPKLQHATLQSYKLKHSLPVDQRGPTYEQDIKTAYENHLAAWRTEVNKWLTENKYQITVEQFEKLYQKDLKDAKKKKDDDDD